MRHVFSVLQEFKKTHPIADIFIDDGGHTMTQQVREPMPRSL